MTLDDWHSGLGLVPTVSTDMFLVLGYLVGLSAGLSDRNTECAQ